MRKVLKGLKLHSFYMVLKVIHFKRPLEQINFPIRFSFHFKFILMEALSTKY